MERVTTRPGIAAQILQQHKFLLRKLQHLPAARGLAPQQVQFKILHAQPRCLACRRAVALEQIAQPRQQLGQRERLGQIVVAALLQSAHPIVNRAPRRQNQDRGAHSQLAQAKDQADAILIGQPKIDDEDVKGALGGQPLGRLAVRRSFHFDIPLPQANAAESPEFRFRLQPARGA